MFRSEIMTALFSFLTYSDDAVLNASEGEAYLFFDNRNIIRFNSSDIDFCRQQAKEIFETLLASENTRVQSLEQEAEYLRWFYSYADFGPADGDVRFRMNKNYVSDGGIIPEGYRDEEEE